MLGRELPGITTCGLWDALAARPPARTAALVTDVGNDLLYGAPVAAILDWVAECLDRLAAQCADRADAVAAVERRETHRLAVCRDAAFHFSKVSRSSRRDSFASRRIEFGTRRAGRSARHSDDRAHRRLVWIRSDSHPQAVLESRLAGDSCAVVGCGGASAGRVRIAGAMDLSALAAARGAAAFRRGAARGATERPLARRHDDRALLSARRRAARRVGSRAVRVAQCARAVRMRARCSAVRGASAHCARVARSARS